MELQTEMNLDPTISMSASDKEQWLGNWIWRATQCLVESPNFNPSPKWIAKRLGVSVEKAVEAIEGLERLGCIARNGTSYKVVSDWMQLSPTKLDSKRLLAAHSNIASQQIAKLLPDDAYTSQFFLANRDLVKKYAPKFMKLFKEMNDEGKRMGHTDVVTAQISFALATGEEAGGAQ